MTECAVEPSAEVMAHLTKKKPMRVLHVDDEPIFLKIAKQCLEMQGSFQVETASSVEEAMEKMKKEAYDAVVCDYQMSGKDGLEFLKELRESGNTVPFVIFTGKGREEVAIKALNLGADQYLNKTGDPETVYCELAYSVRKAAERKRTDDKLKESEDRYRELANSLPEIAFETDNQGKLTFVNEKAHEITGYSQEDFAKGLNAFEFFVSADRERARGNFKKLLRGEKVETNEYAFQRKDGSTFSVLIRSKPIIRENKIIGVRGIVLDVSQVRKTEKKLSENQMRLQNVLAASPEAIVVTDLNGKIIQSNEQAREMFGYSVKDEAFGKSGPELIAEKDRKRAMEDMEKTMTQGFVKDVEYTIVAKGGIERLARVSAKVVKDVSDNPTGCVIVIEDITERKKTEQALRESEEKYRDLFENAMDVILTLDLKGSVTSTNKAILRFGYKKEDIIGRGILNFIPQEHWPTVMRDLTQVAQGGSVRNEIEIRIPEGKKTVQYSSNAMIRNGNIVGVQVVLRDLTERKKAEEKLRESEEKFRSIFESANDYIIHVDTSGKICDINEKAMRAFAGAREEIVGKRFTELDIFPSEAKAFRDLFPKTAAGNLGREAVFEVCARNKKGQQMWLECSQSLVTNNNEATGLLVIARDITDRKNAEEKSVESQQKFEGLFKGNPEATVYTDRNFHILDINPRFASLFGYSLAEVKGKHLDDVVVPKNLLEEAKILDEKSVEGYVYHNTVRLKKDGSLIPVSVSGASILSQGQLTGYIGVYKDISEQKSAEEKLAIVNEKLRVVGGLTRHDVRNKLSVIIGNIFLNKKKLMDHPDIIENFKDMESACNQIVRIFDFAKDYERLGAEELTHVDLENAIEEAVSLFSNLNGTKVINECHGLTVLADSLLRQLFYNLIDNSLKYGQKISKIRIHYEETGQDELKVIYEDDGVGIPTAEKPNLFKEGYSRSGSTGYGLYLIKKMMEVYGWTVQETGTAGKGAQFTITIPKTNPSGKENYQIA